MSGAIRLNAVDLAVFALYLVAAVALGFVVSRRGRTSRTSSAARRDSRAASTVSSGWSRCAPPNDPTRRRRS